MPQMAPMWWEIMLIMFNMTFMLMMINTHWEYKKAMMTEKSENKMKMNKWKW
uniref:ATPase subunit 8 n=1 Tax=Crompus oculatus TaxID=2813432 RepID=A0A8T9ZWR0_9HEMI|nr:ATPase subunit 8 [Crompus oculatus]